MSKAFASKTQGQRDAGWGSRDGSLLATGCVLSDCTLIHRVFRLVTISGVEEVILQRANKKLSIDQKASSLEQALFRPAGELLAGAVVNERARERGEGFAGVLLEFALPSQVIQAGMFDNKSSEDLREEKLRFLLLLSKSDGMDAKATTPKQVCLSAFSALPVGAPVDAAPFFAWRWWLFRVYGRRMRRVSAQLNRILSRSAEELAWFDAYDRRVLGADDEALTLNADSGGAEAAERDALYKPPACEEDERVDLENPTDQEGERAEAPRQGETQTETAPLEQSPGQGGSGRETQRQEPSRAETGSLWKKANKSKEASAECEEEVKALLERHGRIVKSSELPDWLTAAAAAVQAAEALAEEEAANNAESDGEAEASTGVWIARNRKRRNVARPNYCDALSESQYVRLVEKFENGELASEDLQTALAREAEKAQTRRKQKSDEKTLGAAKNKRSRRSKSKQRSPREESGRGFEESPGEGEEDSQQSGES